MYDVELDVDNLYILGLLFTGSVYNQEFITKIKSQNDYIKFVNK